VYCWISEAREFKKCNRDGGQVGFLLNWNIGCTRHTADLALIASRLSQALLHESLTSKWWLSSKVEFGILLKTNF